MCLMAADDAHIDPGNIVQKIIEKLPQEAAPVLEKVRREAFEQGWQAAMRHIGTATSAPPSTFVSESPATMWAQKIFVAANSTSSSEMSTKDHVLRIVRSVPGLRGVDIVATAQKLDPFINERTVRTALHRLKEGKVIVPEMGRWFSTDQFPEKLKSLTSDQEEDF